MELLAILIALILLQVWGSGGPLQRDAWFYAFREQLARRVGGAMLLLVSVLLPAAAVGLLHRVLHGQAYGLPELLLFLTVLLFALGRGDISADIAEYLHRWGRGDFQAAFEQMQHEAGYGPTEPTPPTDARGLHRLMRRRLYYRMHERLFAVLFWFTALGPAGAMAYRLAALQRDLVPAGQETRDSFRLLHWMEWLPARLNAIAFALIGNFDACIDAWRPRVLEADLDAAELIEACGDAALGISGESMNAESQEELIRYGVRDIEAIESLQNRALIVWVVVVAVLLIRF